MSLGVVALILAAAAAGWLLWRSGRGEAAGGEERNVTLLKGVVFLVLAAALFAAKLWPLAFMTLLAAGGVTAIEIWRKRAITLEESARPTPPPRSRAAMQPEEAASVLGIGVDAAPEAVRAAHRQLISQLHPDKGGTDYLAAKINEARDVLLSRPAPASED